MTNASERPNPNADWILLADSAGVVQCAAGDTDGGPGHVHGPNPEVPPRAPAEAPAGQPREAPHESPEEHPDSRPREDPRSAPNEIPQRD